MQKNMLMSPNRKLSKPQEDLMREENYMIFGGIFFFFFFHTKGLDNELGTVYDICVTLVGYHNLKNSIWTNMNISGCRLSRTTILRVLLILSSRARIFPI